MRAIVFAFVLMCLDCPKVALGAGAADRCFVCGSMLGDTVYLVTDKVTGEKVQVCQTCSLLPHTCFLCGLPVKDDYLSLNDGRYLCARDAKNAVTTDEEAKELFEEVHQSLGRLLSRFVNVPEDSVQESMVDRVNLIELFKFAGNDRECPNVWGYVHSETNDAGFHHQISLLSGLPRDDFKAVCAHELGHALLFETVPAQRKRTLGGDATEGFCELVAYMLVDSMHLEETKTHILQNAYTRGQIDLFIAAERQYGFNDVMEWMKYGVDPALRPDDLGRIRNIQQPRFAPKPTTTPVAAVAHYAAPATPAPADLVLKGIIWSPKRPEAMINGELLRTNEQAEVRVGASNVLVRCISISPTTVRVRVMSTGKERELTLPEGH